MPSIDPPLPSLSPLPPPPLPSPVAGAHISLPDHGPVGALLPLRTSQGLLQPGLPQAGVWGGGEGRGGEGMHVLVMLESRLESYHFCSAACQV